jgi:hypothetical protein
MADPPVTFTTLPQGQAISILTPLLRWSWIALALSSIAFELTPISPVPPLTTYGLLVFKLTVFALLGFLPPLAFQRLTTLIWNIGIALGSSVLVEALQAVVHNGHSFHWHELIAKVFLVIGGFCFALVARYERVISAGPLSIRLEAA